MIIVVTGPQGSGKGTQAKLLAEKYGFTHVSIGDILRREAASGSDKGKIIASYMNQGKLIPSDLNNEIVKEELEKHADVVLDGFPRTEAQARFLLSVASVECVFLISISEQESLRRLSRRIICTANNKIFIEDEVSSKDEEECRLLGGKLIKREDDHPDAIKRRLRLYLEETRPAVEFLERSGVHVFKIDGERPVSEIFEDIQEKAHLKEIQTRRDH